MLAPGAVALLTIQKMAQGAFERPALCCLGFAVASVPLTGTAYGTRPYDF